VIACTSNACDCRSKDDLHVLDSHTATRHAITSCAETITRAFGRFLRDLRPVLNSGEARLRVPLPDAPLGSRAVAGSRRDKPLHTTEVERYSAASCPLTRLLRVDCGQASDNTCNSGELMERWAARPARCLCDRKSTCSLGVLVRRQATQSVHVSLRSKGSRLSPLSLCGAARNHGKTSGHDVNMGDASVVIWKSSIRLRSTVAGRRKAGAMRHWISRRRDGGVPTGSTTARATSERRTISPDAARVRPAIFVSHPKL